VIKRICIYKSVVNYNILPALLFKNKSHEKALCFKFWRFHFGIAWSKNYVGEIEWNFAELPPELRGKNRG